jgi:hypothetical protein
VLYFINMSSRDYLRPNSSAHPAVQAVQQAVEILSGGTLEDAEVRCLCCELREAAVVFKSVS